LVENSLADVHFRDSLPREIFRGILGKFITLIKTFDKRVIVRWEIWISPLFALSYHIFDKFFNSFIFSFHSLCCFIITRQWLVSISFYLRYRWINLLFRYVDLRLRYVYNSWININLWLRYVYNDWIYINLWLRYVYNDWIYINLWLRYVGISLKFYHEGVFTLSFCPTPKALNLVHKILTLVVNSMFARILLYKIDKSRLFRPTRHQITIDGEIANLVFALTLDLTLSYLKYKFHGALFTFLHIISFPRLRSRRLRYWLNDFCLYLHWVNHELRYVYNSWININLWLRYVDLDRRCIDISLEFNHHTSITTTTLIAPPTLHPFSILFFAFCSIAEILTLIKNSVLAPILLYKVKVIGLSRPNSVH